MGELFAPMHLLVVLSIALVVFGPGKLPELGSGLGKAIGNFKKGLAEGEREAADAASSPQEQPASERPQRPA
jgi:sec-independent protein translocase protein TatA